MEQLENNPIKKKEKDQKKKKKRPFLVAAWGIDAISLTGFFIVVTFSG